eukprot:COSAG01_NODE_58000_length_308_cov_10.521531_1_plen_40_part_01
MGVLDDSGEMCRIPHRGSVQGSICAVYTNSISVPASVGSA